MYFPPTKYSPLVPARMAMDMLFKWFVNCFKKGRKPVCVDIPLTSALHPPFG